LGLGFVQGLLGFEPGVWGELYSFGAGGELYNCMLVDSR
jgi:hypothetical protein